MYNAMLIMLQIAATVVHILASACSPKYQLKPSITSNQHTTLIVNGPSPFSLAVVIRT